MLRRHVRDHEDDHRPGDHRPPCLSLYDPVHPDSNNLLDRMLEPRPSGEPVSCSGGRCSRVRGVDRSRHFGGFSPIRAAGCVRPL
jgi:hypothetical protein